jgi:hypothetical protein
MSFAFVVYSSKIKRATPTLNDNVVSMGTKKLRYSLFLLKERGKGQSFKNWTQLMSLDTLDFEDRMDRMPTELIGDLLSMQWFQKGSSDAARNLVCAMARVPEGSVVVSFLNKFCAERQWEDMKEGPEYIKVVLPFGVEGRTEDEVDSTHLAIFPSVEEATKVLDENGEEKNDDGTYAHVTIVPWDAYGKSLSVGSVEVPLYVKLAWGKQEEDNSMVEE